MKENFWVTKPSEEPSIIKKRKRGIGKRRIDFIGWGSRPLIEFLASIGQDTSNQRSRHEVVTLINKYIAEKGLACSVKKKKITCDEILYAIFGKKTILRTKVHELLEEHFAENHDSSDDDFSDSSDGEGFREKKSFGSEANSQMNKAPENKIRSCFAAVCVGNIKVVYLEKSLIEQLLKDPAESCESKIVGSFVRMKCDPNDIFQKNPFQLQLVTGVERVSGAEILLKVSNFFKDIPISMLSDGNFEEVEVEDVRERIKSGLLKRLLISELQSKAQMLHVDITKNWIAKELKLLKNSIEHANIKGWRKKLFELRERKKRLETPSEVEKILHTLPKVIAEDELEEVEVVSDSEKAKGRGHSQKPSISQRSSDALGSRDVVASPQDSLDDSNAQKVQDVPADSFFAVDDKETQTLDLKEKEKQEDTATVLIDISDDESSREDDEDWTVADDESPSDVIWHYMDPKGNVQGPFSLNLMKRWNDLKYFHSGFRIWKSGQTLDDGVVLVDVLRRFFHDDDDIQ